MGALEPKILILQPKSPNMDATFFRGQFSQLDEWG